MDSRIESLEGLVAQLQKELEELKGGDRALPDSYTGHGSVVDFPPGLYRELQQKIDKIEGNLGVDKIILTDVGDKVLVTVQTPLGTVPVTVPHTSNTSSRNQGRGVMLDSSQVSGSSVAIAPPPITNIKGGPPAGMTTEQLQDFKKQTLQINQLQQKIKDLESRLSEANSLIKKGEDVTLDITNKEADDVKEIYMYLDDINNTMSQKIAAQRVEMEKLAGDAPQPINYDPFNYGEAYAGDVVDFEARKRIVEMDLLFQSLQVAMIQLKDSVRVSPSIDLGYKVVRLDQLVEATGFGASVRNGELSTDNGLLVNQSNKFDPPEKRYPRKEAFQTDEEKEYQWSVTDSIMQTMYRLEVELGQLQKTVGGSEGQTCSPKEMEEMMAYFRQVIANPGIDEQTVKQLVERECHYQIRHARVGRSSGRSNDQHFDSSIMTKLLQSLQDQVKDLDTQMEALSKSHHERTKRHSQPKVSVAFLTCKHVDSFYKQPVKLRYLLQRVFRSYKTSDYLASYKMPRPVGIGYQKAWPKANPLGAGQPANVAAEVVESAKQNVSNLQDLQYSDGVVSAVEPQSQEFGIRGKDGRWYKGANRPTKSAKPAVMKKKVPR